jgi:hypothetical protein
VRLSNPTDIKLGTYEVTGKIREAPGDGPAPAWCFKQLKPMDNRLAELLEEKRSFDNSEAAAWRSYVPMLVLTGFACCLSST